MLQSTKIQHVFFAVALALSSSFVLAQDKLPAGVIAKVNGVEVPASWLELGVKNLISQGQKDSPELRQAIKDELITREMLSQDAVKLGLEKLPDVQIQLAQIRQNFLIDVLFTENLKKNPITDEQIKAEYDREMKLLAEEQQYKLSLIIVPTEAEAKTVLARLKKGEAFAKVAKEVSADPSKKDGGVLDWILPAQLVPAVASVIPNITKGSLAAAPILTPTGWAIVKVDDKRVFKAPVFEQVKEQLRMGLMQQQRMVYVKKLKDATKIQQ